MDRASAAAAVASGCVRAPSGCLEWVGTRDRGGYGRLRAGGRWFGAHRLALEHATGLRLPSTVMVLHGCDNPPCCEPAHLGVGVAADNAADREARGRTARGVGHGMATLSDAQVEAVIAARAAGGTLRAVGAAFGISHVHVLHLCQGKYRARRGGVDAPG